jgi:hypothetical protein
MPTVWPRGGKNAAAIRDTELVKMADALVAVWDGKSKGTNHLIRTATARNLKVFVLRTDQTGTGSVEAVP